tara:strand:- start:166 stop:273 length:108 start_codon:yes stop_codon:yes gene_type:complete
MINEEETESRIKKEKFFTKLLRVLKSDVPEELSTV